MVLFFKHNNMVDKIKRPISNRLCGRVTACRLCKSLLDRYYKLTHFDAR